MALKELEGKIYKDFIVMAGDIIANADLNGLMNFHLENNATISILYREDISDSGKKEKN